MKTDFLSLRVWSSVCFALLLFAGAVGRASADNILYTGEGINDGNVDVTIGLDFTPTQDITVTHLGVLSGGNDGPNLQTDHVIGLWTDAGTLLASATVVAPTGGTLQHGFRFVPVNPVNPGDEVLYAGQTYVLATNYPSSGDKQWFDDTSSFLNPYPLINISPVPRAVGGSSPLVFPAPFPTWQDELRLCANMLFTPINPSLVGDGDVNNDTSVDAADVALATRIVLGMTPTANQVVKGDIAPYSGGVSQPDNEITMADLMLIMRIALGTFTLP